MVENLTQYYPLACFVDVQTAIKEVLELKVTPVDFIEPPVKIATHAINTLRSYQLWGLLILRSMRST